MKILLAACLVLLCQQAGAQGYKFNHDSRRDKYLVEEDEGQLTCLYLVADEVKTVYKKVFLDDDLRIKNSVNYVFPGKVELMSSWKNPQVNGLTFRAIENKEVIWLFLITTKDGRVRNRFSKSIDDFRDFLGKDEALENVKIKFIPDANPEILLINLLPKEGGPKTIALNTHDGSLRWHNNGMLENPATTDSLLIGIKDVKGLGKLIFVNRQTGALINSIPLSVNGRKKHVETLVTNGKRILIAGNELKEGSTNSISRLFVSMFDMKGNLIYERADTSKQDAGLQKIIATSAFNCHGDLVIMSQGFELDVKSMAINAVGGFFMAAMSGGMVGAKPDKKPLMIEYMFAAVLSARDGMLKDYYAFPVGPWPYFAKFYTYNEFVLFGVRDTYLLYNTNTPSEPPSVFARIPSYQQLILTKNGPVVVYKNDKFSVIDYVKP